MSNAWAKVIEAIASLIERWGRAIAFFFAGKSAGKTETESKIRDAKDKAAEDQHEKDSEFERLRRDDDFRDRVRDALRDKDAGPGR